MIVMRSKKQGIFKFLQSVYPLNYPFYGIKNSTSKSAFKKQRSINSLQSSSAFNHNFTISKFCLRLKETELKFHRTNTYSGSNRECNVQDERDPRWTWKKAESPVQFIHNTLQKHVTKGSGRRFREFIWNQWRQDQATAEWIALTRRGACFLARVHS